MAKTITVLGTGYVGLTTAALLANSGYKVFAVEINKERLDVIKQGRSFFFEEGLDPVIKAGIDSGNLIATDSYELAVPDSDVIFSCVGTPDNPDGSSNLEYVFGSAKQAASLAKDNAIFVQKSTVPVGTGDKIISSFKEEGKKISYVSNPEFLRESTALYDTLYFDRIVVGGESQTAVQAILDIYKQLENSRDQIADIAKIEKSETTGRYIATKLISAELIKVTANAFLALKISFSNSIAKLSDSAGADINEVMDAVGADPRIGRAFLNAGRGFGGGCFPKDVSGLISSGLENGIDLDIMQAVQSVNKSMPGYIVEKMKGAFGGSFKDKQVAVLGLAFKSGTSDTRKSPGIALANLLARQGAKVKAYDPEASEEAKPDVNNKVQIVNDLESAAKDSDAVLIVTDWAEFTDTPVDQYAGLMRGKLFVDGMNCFDPEAIKAAGLQYIGVGRG